MENARIAQVFVELADRLELQGENPFKAKAYRTFAAEVQHLGEPLVQVAAEDRLGAVAGAGKAIVAKVQELLARGTFDALERARAEVPGGLLDVLRLPGVGAKTARALWESAQVTTVEELAAACEDDRLAELPGFGKKKQAKLLDAVQTFLGERAAVLLATAIEAGEILSETLMSAGATHTALVGEARRGLELVRDIELLSLGLDAHAVGQALADHDDELLVRDLDVRSDVEAVSVTLQGRGRARVVCVADPHDWVGAVLAHTGDAAHVAWLEDLARGHGGLRALARTAASEGDVYARLGLTYVPPELRQGPAPTVPDGLVELADLRGIFHVHTTWSDGSESIRGIAQAARSRGHRFVGIGDHSRAASYANGLDPDRLREQAVAIREARSQVEGIRILHGVEVDILPDGSLDLDDATLGALDFVIASVHSRFAMSVEEMTARIVRAVSHPLVNMLGHPTGRLLLARKGYQFDVDRVAEACARNDVLMEINANAHRLDLSPPMVRHAASHGVTFVVNPDAHQPRGLDDVPLGVTVARRAGLRREQVANTSDATELLAAFARKREAHRSAS